MTRKKTVSVPFIDDERNWLVEGKVWFGAHGTLEDPPEPDDVELIAVTEDLGNRLGPPQTFDFGSFVVNNDLSHDTISKLEDDAIQAAYND